MSCNLSIAATVAGSELALSSVVGDFLECPGYTGGTSAVDSFFSLSEPVGTLTFTGAACDESYSWESYDVAGRFDFHVAGGENNSITLADQHLIFEGGVRGDLPSGECAAPP